MIAGGTTTYGTGYWRFSMPFAVGSLRFGGATLIHDASVPTKYVGYAMSGFAEFGSNQQLVVMRDNVANVPVGAAAPMAWATSDYLVVDAEFSIA
jgi:hypothetical protein